MNDEVIDAPAKKRAGRPKGSHDSYQRQRKPPPSLPDNYFEITPKLPNGMTPLPHGGALLLRDVPTPQGVIDHQEGMNPRAVRKRLLADLHSNVGVIGKKLIETARGEGDGVDSRARLVATEMVFNRVLGKAGDLPQGAENESTIRGDVPMEHLTPDEQVQLSDALDTVARLGQLAKERAANE